MLSTNLLYLGLRGEQQAPQDMAKFEGLEPNLS